MWLLITLGSRYRLIGTVRIMRPPPPCLIHYWYKSYPYIPRYLYIVRITRTEPGPLLCTDKDALASSFVPITRPVGNVPITWSPFVPITRPYCIFVIGVLGLCLLDNVFKINVQKTLLGRFTYTHIFIFRSIVQQLFFIQ